MFGDSAARPSATPISSATCASRWFQISSSAGALMDSRRSEEHTSELQSPCNLVCRLLLEKNNTCPLTKETHHLFNRQRFARMKSSAWLINVGRGAVVQEEALIEALRARRIAGAMLDVYEHYRLAPGHPLFALDNVVLTPHLAGMTVESRSRVSQLAVEEMLRMLAGE